MFFSVGRGAITQFNENILDFLVVVAMDPLTWKISMILTVKERDATEKSFPLLHSDWLGFIWQRE